MGQRWKAPGAPNIKSIPEVRKRRSYFRRCKQIAFRPDEQPSSEIAWKPGLFHRADSSQHLELGPLDDGRFSVVAEEIDASFRATGEAE